MYAASEQFGRVLERLADGRTLSDTPVQPLTGVRGLRNVCLMTNTANAATPTTFFPAVDMGDWGMCVIEVQALTYADAYRGAVEQFLIDPHGTLRHAITARLMGDL